MILGVSMAVPIPNIGHDDNEGAQVGGVKPGQQYRHVSPHNSIKCNSSVIRQACTIGKVLPHSAVNSL